MTKNKRYSVLLLLRKNDEFCIKFLKFISLNSKQIRVLWLNNPNKKILINKKYDFIISYRSPIILKSKEISMAKISAINLHPGSPKYRGVGCLNYALYNNEKKYGFTIHLINKKIDYGKILFVKYFNIKRNSTVRTLLQETHKQCIRYSKSFFKSILSDASKIESYKKKFQKEKWSKIIKNRSDLDKFYQIKNFDLENVNRKIRATNFGYYKPFIQIGTNKFFLKKNEK